MNTQTTIYESSDAFFFKWSVSYQKKLGDLFFAEFIFISFHSFLYITQQLDKLVTASLPIIILLRPYTFGMIGFRAGLLLHQQDRKYKLIYILANLPHLDIAVRPNGESGSVSVTGIDRFQVTIKSLRPLIRRPLLSCALVYVLCNYLLCMYPL
jgi:hypothetical protein